MISFTSLADYMWYLRGVCERLGTLGSRVMLYMAAAVSDFYIPSSAMPKHKIQSSEGTPKIQLQLVPKMLHPLVKYWVPDAYVISFKLETDPELLESKAIKALQTYHHQMVIANLLNNRKRKVSIIESSDDPNNLVNNKTVIELGDSEIENGTEIEERIISFVCDIHKKFCISRHGELKS